MNNTLLSMLGERRGSFPRPNKRIESFFSPEKFEVRFTKAVQEAMTSATGKLFKTAAAAMISKLVDMVWITDPPKVSYLVPLVEYAEYNKSSIVTLNYDNAIELAGHTTGVEIDTGFDEWSNSGEFVFDENKTPLLKLHGSIDWALSPGKQSGEKPLPFQVIHKVNPDEMKKRRFRPEVLFGAKNKLTARGPYLSLLRSFETSLSRADLLTVIGYSFRDEHVNEFISNWFNGNQSASIRIIDPKLTSRDNGYLEALLDGPGRTRVQSIKNTAEVAIAELFSQISP
jgi:hypothetical protein